MWFHTSSNKLISMSSGNFEGILLSESVFGTGGYNMQTLKTDGIVGAPNTGKHLNNTY